MVLNEKTTIKKNIIKKKTTKKTTIMIIQQTTAKDTNALTALFAEARQTIAALGIDQWQNGYPSAEVIKEDVQAERSYAVKQGEALCGTFVLLFDGEPTYDVITQGEWLTGTQKTGKTRYTAIHRVAIAVASRKTGVAGKIIRYAQEQAKAHGHVSLRIDTHAGNVPMRRMLEKNGFVYCGVIFLQDGAERVAYEKILTNQHKTL